jgi:hypothetical protein
MAPDVHHLCPLTTYLTERGMAISQGMLASLVEKRWTAKGMRSVDQGVRGRKAQDINCKGREGSVRVAVKLDGCLDVCRIRGCHRRLRHREARTDFAIQKRLQPASLLLLGTIFEQHLSGCEAEINDSPPCFRYWRMRKKNGKEEKEEEEEEEEEGIYLHVARVWGRAVEGL